MNWGSPMSDVNPIDIHTHLFNLRYLPVEGILTENGLFSLGPVLAKILAPIVIALTEKDTSLDPGSSDIAAAGNAAAIGDGSEDMVSLVARLAEDVPRDLLTGTEMAAELDLNSFFTTAMSFAGGFGKRLILKRLINRIIDTVEDGAQAVKWIFNVMTQRERDIAARLIATYGDVDLFVHHTMDMDNHYGGDAPKYDFADRQVQRMRNLDAAHNGKLLTFVAWDPFRDDCLEIVTRGVEQHGCGGIKFYPPSGYRPIGNSDSSFEPNPKGSPPGPVLDQRNTALFDFCVNNDLPLFTHCSEIGFQAYKNSGKNSDPDFWSDVLNDARWHDLRLCFGHAGGRGWFRPDADFQGSFAHKVYQLCTGPFPNVYCGVGILDHVREQAEFDLLQNRLSVLIAATPVFAERIMYGSDWHLLYLRADHEDFLDRYRELFTDPGLTMHARNFFRDNAARYLKRPGLLLPA